MLCGLPMVRDIADGVDQPLSMHYRKSIVRSGADMSSAELVLLHCAFWKDKID